jgi:hypothetical protein
VVHSQAVYVVAIAQLATAVDVEAVPLAADLGATVYEARLLLAAGVPVVVKSTADKATALDLLAKLRARRHGAVACDAASVVAANAMTTMRRFRVGVDAVSLDDRPDERLDYEDVLAFIVAVHRRRTETATETRDRQFSATRAIASGGVLLTKTVKTATHTTTEDRERVLYVFRKSGARPWILHERGTIWAGLGRPVAPTESENFRVAIDVLRERAPAAAYDDRLVTRKGTPERTAVAGTTGAATIRTSSEGGVDLLAHVLALFLFESRASP